MLWIINHLLIVTMLAAVVGVGLIPLMLVLLDRIYHHEGRRPLYGSGLVAILVTVLFPVIVNNWYAIKRDRDNRLRALRDQHFGQLRPVLRTESSKFQEIAAQAAKQGHLSGVNHYETIPEFPGDALWPDVMSRDLKQHFPTYDKAKESLVSEIRAQDEEFRKTVSTAEDQIKPAPDLDPYWKDVATTSFVEQCTGRGNGMTLRIFDAGYSFSYWGASTSASGGGSSPPRPSPDQVAGFRAFQSLRPDASLISHCDSLKRRAEAITHDAETLSKDAQLNSESTILKGDCEYLRSDNLSD
jgi:hypothetical protein